MEKSSKYAKKSLDKSLISHLQSVDEALSAALKDLQRPSPDRPPELAFAKPQFPQPGWETDWQSCTSSAVTAGASHLIGCVIDGQNPGESADDMIKRCGQEAELVSLFAQLRCWIGKKAGGGVFK